MVHRTIETLSETEQHELLADELRRQVIEIFGATNGPIESTLGELASDIDRAIRYDTGGVGRQDLLVRLHHVHLPMLQEAGIIEYDRETKRIWLLESATAATLAHETTAR